MNPSKSFLESCLADPITWQRQTYDIGGYYVNIHYESESIFLYFHTALAHLALNDSTHADFQIFVRDHATFPRPFWNWDEIDNQGNLVPQGPININYEHWSGILRLFDPVQNKGVFWVRDLSSIPIWHRSFPFRTLLTRFFESTAIQPVHSAAVAWQGKAALLAGHSGSGKSSTALASLVHGLDFLGDDFNLVHVDKQKVHSLYGIAKLEKHQLQTFPALQQFPRVGDDEKDQIEVAQHFPDQMKQNAVLKGVVLPKISHREESQIIPISPQEALKQMSQSTLELLQGNRMTHFHKIGRICRTLPCYQLALSTDYREIVHRLRTFLEDEK